MEKTKNKIISIDKAVNNSKKMVYFALIIAIVSILGNLIFGYYVFSKTSNNIYVLDKDGNIGSAEKQDLSSQLEAEADNHLKMFYSTFFSYDVVNVEENVKKGVELGGESVKELWRMYSVENWYNRVKQSNLIVNSRVDSTFFDFKYEPYRARVYGTQTITNGSVSENRTLNIDCVIKKVGRVKEINPHGMLIDKITITSNQKIE